MKVKIWNSVKWTKGSNAPDSHRVTIKILGIDFVTDCTGPDTARALVEKLIKEFGLTNANSTTVPTGISFEDETIDRGSSES